MKGRKALVEVNKRYFGAKEKKTQAALDNVAQLEEREKRVAESTKKLIGDLAKEKPELSDAVHQNRYDLQYAQEQCYELRNAVQYHLGVADEQFARIQRQQQQLHQFEHARTLKFSVEHAFDYETTWTSLNIDERRRAIDTWLFERLPELMS